MATAPATTTTTSLSCPSPPSPSQSSTTATTPVAPSQLVATSGAITTTKTIPINLPVHAATAPPATSTNELRGAGIDDAQGSSRRRAGTTSTATTTGTRMGTGMMRRRPSSTALALRRVASRVSLRTTDNIVDNDNDNGVDTGAPSSTPLVKRDRERGRQRKMHQTSTRRWLHLERPLECRELDALVMAWVVSVWMDMDGQGPGLTEDGSD